MKKVVILLAIASLLAAPAFAGIRNSKHDLSSSSGIAGTLKSNNVDELCVFCHTPHGGVTGGFAPLWNRSGATADLLSTELYNSATIEVGITNPTTVLDAVNASDAKLCLSCHDGQSLAGGLLNPPASASNVQPAFAGGDSIVGNANLYDGSSKLTNDHPIGMTYDAALNTADSEIKLAYSADFADSGEKLPLYTKSGDYTSVMWCSTCHDVHNPAKGTPFLNMSNAGSAMCLTCHDK